MQRLQAASPAPRFTLALPMRYRLAGQLQWKDAKTVNVSASGLLFLTAERLAPGTRIEIEVSMASSNLKPTHMHAVSEVLRQTGVDQLLLTTLHHVSSQTVDGDFSA